MSRKFTLLELELSSKCNAACPQCPREQPNIKELLKNEHQEITLHNVIAWFPKDFLSNLKTINFKGTYSEPVIAHDFYNIVEYFINNTAATINIHTNGSLRKQEFWSNLGNILKHRGKVIFALDGLNDTHNIYRVNTNYERIIENATAFIASGGIATWQFIVFKHNEHQVETAKKIAKDIGFCEFLLIASERFESSESFNLTTKNNLIEKSKNYIAPTFDQSRENFHKTKSVSCKSSSIGWLVVDWNGEVFPCCMSQIWKHGVMNMPIDSQIWYKKVVKSTNSTNLNYEPIENVLVKLETFYENLGKKYIPGICAWNCGDNKLKNHRTAIDLS